MHAPNKSILSVAIALACLFANFSTIHAQSQYEVEVLHDFERPESAVSPESELVQAADGSLFGVTSGGGKGGAGVVYRIQSDGSGYTVIWNLRYFLEGSVVRGRPLLASDGRLYIATRRGGLNDKGAIFSVGTDGSDFQLIHAFEETTGGRCDSGVIEGLDGNLYGATSLGGQSGGGTVFSIGKDGSDFSVLLNFPLDNREIVTPGLVEASNGKLYGVARLTGGSRGQIFSINPDGSGFQQFTSVENVGAELTQGFDGFLYGTTGETIFRVDLLDTIFETLWTLDGDTEGESPDSALIEDSVVPGVFYGTCREGGPLDEGTLFSFNATSSSFTLLRAFSRADGETPAGITQGLDGRIYGTNIYYGGSLVTGGTIYGIDPAGTSFSVLNIFGFTVERGAYAPSTSLVQGVSGRYFGTTWRGLGSFYGIDADGGNFSVNYDYSDPSHDPALEYPPVASLFRGSDDRFYGVNGIADTDFSIFSVIEDGSDMQLVIEFNDDGELADGEPINGIYIMEASDSRIYGTVFREDGEGGDIFRINLDGSGYENLVLLSDFGITDNVGPLLEVPDGRLFGASRFHIYYYDPIGNTVFFAKSFNSASEGEFCDRLSLGSDGLLYGTCQQGGQNGDGTLFALDPDTNDFEVLHQFDFNTDVGIPVLGVVEGIDGFLYGKTTSYPNPMKSSIYRVQKDGTGFETIWTFNDDPYDLDPLFGNDIIVEAELTVGADGNIYGTSELGGIWEGGTIFRLINFDATVEGEDVVVAPAPVDENGDPVEDAPGILLDFDEVTDSGTTTITVTETAPPIPDGFELAGDEQVFFDIETTATFTGQVEVCLDYSGLTISGDPADLVLLHYEVDEWVDITTLNDTENGLICGLTSSFSPFAIVVAENPLDILDELEDAVAALDTFFGVKFLLKTKLKIVKRVLTDKRARNDKLAPKILEKGFIKSVESMSGKFISSSEADELISKANAVLQTL